VNRRKRPSFLSKQIKRPVGYGKDIEEDELLACDAVYG
jgi:hypothetical protein